MLHLHALSPVPTVGPGGLAVSDALLVSTVNPGRMARVTVFEGDFLQVHLALESGQLANAGQPLECEEVDNWVARALGESPPTSITHQKSA